MGIDQWTVSEAQKTSVILNFSNFGVFAKILCGWFLHARSFDQLASYTILKLTSGKKVLCVLLRESCTKQFTHICMIEALLHSHSHHDLWLHQVWASEIKELVHAWPQALTPVFGTITFLDFTSSADVELVYEIWKCMECFSVFIEYVYYSWLSMCTMCTFHCNSL